MIYNDIYIYNNIMSCKFLVVDDCWAGFVGFYMFDTSTYGNDRA